MRCGSDSAPGGKPSGEIQAGMGTVQMGQNSWNTETNLIEMEPVSHVQKDNRMLDHLYALSAVLMDGASGRILYEKEGEVPRPNASTTKILTCILALENAPGDDYVTISAKAAAQPDVQLNLREGEQYYLEDLLYSLMLQSHNDTAVAIAEHIGGSVEGFARMMNEKALREGEQYYLEDLLYSLMLQSHNDTAVAIAEHIGGSVEGFARMMNEKAREIGCKDTYFITPNGLDARDSKGEHHTTARDLALLMRYAIKNETFLKITQTQTYHFGDLKKQREFSLHNTNALLNMTDGVLSGKTGFTGKAGYCYVCACKKDGKTFVVSLLGCGWPNNKQYKWSDTLALLSYGAKEFAYVPLWKEPNLPWVLVENGVSSARGLGEAVYLKGNCAASEEEQEKQILLQKGERLTYRQELPRALEAPVKKGEQIGKYVCTLHGEIVGTYPITAEKSVEKISYRWCVDQIFDRFFH